MIQAIFFYIFSFIILSSAVMVISSRNPVHSVLFLILAFFNSAGLFVMLGAEFLAMMLIIVYVGAVAVLFLFVVMMLNINISEMKEGFQKYLPVGLLIGIILLAEIFFVISGNGIQRDLNINVQTIPNTHLIGSVLYTDYIYLFQLSGLILLVAMVGAITLTLRERIGVKKQIVNAQTDRKISDVIEVIKVNSKE
mgnify:FL=1